MTQQTKSPKFSPEVRERAVRLVLDHRVASWQHELLGGEADQTIAFTSTVPSPANVAARFVITASGGASGNSVTIANDAASTSGACTISGSTVSFTGVGTCVIDANQAGNANYNAAARAATGVDVPVHPGLLIGVVVQLDWMIDSAGQTGAGSEGRDGMVGRYQLPVSREDVLSQT